MIRHRWEHHEVSGWGGFDCSCSRASFQENHQYHAHRRRALFLEAKVAVGKNKATKAIDNWKGSVQRKVLVERGPRFRCAIRCVHRKGAPDRKPTPNAETWDLGSGGLGVRGTWGPGDLGSGGLGVRGTWGQTEFQVNLKLGLTMRSLTGGPKRVEKCPNEAKISTT